MVVSIDLKPMSEETIAQMGYNAHDLWLVKIGSIVFGPFETESLKHYVGDNEHLFETAEASRADETEWNPFWAHTKFQRRKPQVVNGEAHQGPFWLMDSGLKVGPFSFRDIDKKIEMDLLGMTDHISIDNGETWKKIYEIEGFDRRSHSPDELPIAPLDVNFQKAKLALVEKLERPHVNTTDELADMAWIGHQQGEVIQLKLEEMTIRHEKNVELSSALKWVGPAAAAMLVVVVTSGYFMFSSEDEAIVAENAEEKPFYQKSAGNEAPVKARGTIPGGERSPASVGYSESHRPTYNDSRYPTHVETHDEYVEEPQIDRDPVEGPVTDAEQRPQEQSLVNNGQDEQSLDAAMNGTNQPVEQPVIEESSDF